jgi:hypothetical protein
MLVAPKRAASAFLYKIIHSYDCTNAFVKNLDRAIGANIFLKNSHIKGKVIWLKGDLL